MSTLSIYFLSWSIVLLSDVNQDSFCIMMEPEKKECSQNEFLLMVVRLFDDEHVAIIYFWRTFLVLLELLCILSPHASQIFILPFRCTGN